MTTRIGIRAANNTKSSSEDIYTLKLKVNNLMSENALPTNKVSVKVSAISRIDKCINLHIKWMNSEIL